jgi:hypothetical protein
LDAFQGIKYTTGTWTNNLLEREIKVYPNLLRVNQKFIVTLKVSSISSFIRVLNLNGQIVTEILVENQNKFELNCSQMGKGVYFIQISNSNQKWIETFAVK